MKIFSTSFLFYLSLLLFGLIYLPVKSDNDPQLPFIKKYENVFYDSNLVHNRHLRVSRSLDPYLYINFNGLNKTFTLKLKPMKSLFEHDYIEINNEPLATNNYLFYDGYLTNDPKSYASGSIIDGVFYGSIKSNDGIYYIESSKKYIKNSSELKSESIIYHENDVIYNRNKRSTTNEHVGCASENTYKWMKDIQREAYETNVKNEGFNTYYTYIDHENSQESVNAYKNKYSKEANLNIRKKRSPVRLPFPNNKTVCNLYLKVDPVLYKEIYRNEGNGNNDITVKFLMNYLQKHVEALNSIYSGLQFFNDDKNEYYVGLQFSIHRTRVITTDMCKPENIGNLTIEERNLCEPYLDVQAFLSYVSLDNYTQFCLAYTFTARDFADGTLGLAWVAKPSGSIGGVCERRQVVQGVQKSLNSGILTVINYQARVAEAVSHITFAHEVGHNFGAEHDMQEHEECTPGDAKGGNYIMYSRATTGTLPNNRNFSICSKNAMGKVMFSLVKSPKFCFEANKGPLCGNLIVEEGEECDCGFQEECKESCCHPANSELKCKRVEGALCSPSQGPCCDDNCQFFSRQKTCLKATECLKEVFCNGSSPLCPSNDPYFFINTDENGKLKDCNDGTQVCHNGVCSGSICEKYKMKQCYLEGNLKDKTVDKTVLCHLACEGELTNNLCTDSFQITDLYNPKRNASGFILKPGSACSGTQGYCDIFSKCRAVDAEGPLSRLKNLVLNPRTLTDIRTWVTDHWWAVVLIVIGVLVFMGVFVKVCSVHTPSSNPRRPPALKISETLRRPMKRNRQTNSRQQPSSNRTNKNHHNQGLSNRIVSSKQTRT